MLIQKNAPFVSVLERLYALHGKTVHIEGSLSYEYKVAHDLMSFSDVVVAEVLSDDSFSNQHGVDGVKLRLVSAEGKQVGTITIPKGDLTAFSAHDDGRLVLELGEVIVTIWDEVVQRAGAWAENEPVGPDF
jgi:hypothetical protein